MKYYKNTKVAVRGVHLHSLAAEIRYKNRLDLCLIKIEGRSNSVVRFTKNRFPAAPVTISKRHLNIIEPKYFLINAGNANAATGQRGETDTINICQAVSTLAGCAKEEVLMFSTGVIGELLLKSEVK